MVATPLPMLPLVDEAERERHERRLERDRRRREQGKQAYFDPGPSAQEPEERSTMILRPSHDAGVLAGLEAEAFDAEGFATQPAGMIPPAVAQETPESARGLARSGVIFALATGLSRVIGLVREIAQATVRLAELDAGAKGGSRLPADLQLERTLVEITRPAK